MVARRLRRPDRRLESPAGTCLAVRQRRPWPGRPLAAQIGWTHHQVLLDAFGEHPELYAWYAAKAAEQRWSRRHLKGQIDLRLHERQGSAVTNFAAALGPPERPSLTVGVQGRRRGAGFRIVP